MVHKLRSFCLALAVIVVSAGTAAADRPKIVEEAGAPGSGVKKVIKVYRETGQFAPNPEWVESNRTLIYNDGTGEDITFYDDGVTIMHKRRSDATGLTTRFTEFDKSGLLRLDTVKEAGGKSVVYVNVDSYREKTADIVIHKGDDLYLVSTLDSWPGHRSDKLNETKSGSLVNLNMVKAPASAPQHAKVHAGFNGKSLGTGELKFESTFVSAGFPGPRGRPPVSKTYIATIGVKVR